MLNNGYGRKGVDAAGETRRFDMDLSLAILPAKLDET